MRAIYHAAWILASCLLLGVEAGLKEMFFHWINGEGSPASGVPLPKRAPYTIDPNYKLPERNGLHMDRTHTCFHVASQTPQPVNNDYNRRHAPPQLLPGGMPRVFSRWEGNISRQESDAVPASIRGPECIYCDETVRYQIVGGYLYRQGGERNWLVQVAEDVLLVAIHLFDLPDMDFIMNFGDSCPPGNIPVLSWNICKHHGKAGWAFPSYTSWMHALGKDQLTVLYQCLANRYPYYQSARINRVLWRGSTTDTRHSGLKIVDVDRMHRLMVHKRFRDDPIIDAKIYQIVQTGDNCIKEYLGPLAPKMELTDFNTYTIVMDMDGNGWSDRMAQLMHFPVPILKQASNHTAFFEHLLVEGDLVTFYENDLSDLKEKGYALVADWLKTQTQLVQQFQRRQGIAKEVLNNVGVAEAMAYGLLDYSKHLTWQTVRNPAYEYVPFSKACKPAHQHLPHALCEEIRSRPTPA